MLAQNSLFDLPSLESVIDRTPLTASANTLVSSAIALMSQAQENRCELEYTSKSPTLELLNRQRNSCLLIVEAGKLVGIFTERDVVKLAAAQRDLNGITIAQVMTKELVTLKRSPNQTILTALSLLHQHRIRHLPILDAQEHLAGLITQTDLLQAINPAELLRVVAMLQQQVGEKTTTLEQEISRRQQAEAELKQINDRLEMKVQNRTAELTDFIENAVVPMHWITSDGKIAWANQAELDLLGYAKEEYIGRSIVEFHADRPVIDQLLRQLSNNETVQNYQARLCCKDGSIRHVLIDSNVSWHNGEFLHTRCFTRDVSEQQQVEQQLQATLRSLEFQKSALDRAAIVAITDTKGIIIYVNERFCQISKYAKAELIGQTHRIINSGYHPAEFFQELWTTIAKGKVWQGEIKNRAKDGSFYWVETTIVPFLDETGKPFQYLAIRFDISDRKQAEQKIREQAALLDLTTDGIIVRDLESVIQFWNQGATRIYGWQTSEIIGQNLRSLLYKEISPQIESAYAIVLEQGEWQGELRKVTKTGKEVIVASRWTLVRDEAGNPKFILSVDTDITEQKLLEAQFLRAQRMESLGTLAGGVAHDLNNILAPILGFSKLLPLKLADADEQTKEFFKIIETNAQRGAALVKQILTFSRGMEGERGIVQVRHLITEIKQIIEETFPKAIQLETNVSKNLWTVNGNVNQLHQVLMNLVVNARDAMPQGGKLTITAENFPLDANFARRYLDAQVGSYIVITVTDTGVGIPAEIIERIFEPFFTTKEVERGTGLGLSTLIGIVKSHAGFVDVVSNTKSQPRGTQFKVFLPASETAETNLEATESIPQGNGELILVVDDEPSILEVTKATLEIYNYQVLTASNGIEAIALYAQNQNAIKLVVMDIMMPSMDGKTAIRILKTINSKAKIIVVSGLVSDQEIVTEINGNINAFVAKPYSNNDLLKAINEVVNP
ncbi:MAG: PAS domain S-box protein [Pleurocapsa sp. SU_5_0]|nr:PAS domain S-box protein [Pleurocapsa sp. SU_5_0]